MPLFIYLSKSFASIPRASAIVFRVLKVVVFRARIKSIAWRVIGNTLENAAESLYPDLFISRLSFDMFISMVESYIIKTNFASTNFYSLTM